MLGETVWRASLGGGELWWPRSSPGGEAGSGRRVYGGRSAQALGTGAGALERQRPQERWARCPRHRLVAASRNGRLAAVDPEIGSEVLRLLSERREDLVAERTWALEAACTGSCGTSSPAG
jgi:hypothetical protein